MKKGKLLVTGIAVLTIAGSSLAFKGSNYFSSGSVYCSTTCSTLEQVAFKIDCSGVTDQVTNPCGGTHESNLAYYINASCVCLPTISGTTKFVATTNVGN